MSEYKVTVVEHSKKRLAGLKVKTSMRTAQADCPGLWQAFGRRISEIRPDGCQESYGVCIMLNTEDFYYWAAVELDLSGPLPSGLEEFELSAGLYAKAAVPSLDKLGPAYTYLYEDWLKGQPGYHARLEAPSFELYPSGWQITDAFEILMPISAGI